MSLSLRQFRILKRLCEKPYRIGDLASSTDVTQPTVSTSVAALAKRNLVAKAPDPTDGRVQLIFITRSGRKVVEEADRCLIDRLSEVCQDVTDDDLTCLLRLESVLMDGMDRVRDRLLQTRATSGGSLG